MVSPWSDFEIHVTQLMTCPEGRLSRVPINPRTENRNSERIKYHSKATQFSGGNKKNGGTSSIFKSKNVNGRMDVNRLQTWSGTGRRPCWPSTAARGRRRAGRSVGNAAPAGRRTEAAGRWPRRRRRSPGSSCAAARRRAPASPWPCASSTPRAWPSSSWTPPARTCHTRQPSLAQR